MNSVKERKIPTFEMRGLLTVLHFRSTIRPKLKARYDVNKMIQMKKEVYAGNRGQTHENFHFIEGIVPETCGSGLFSFCRTVD
jgi:hypothetical protein